MAHILIVEHNQMTSDYLRTLLRKSGHIIQVAGNSLDAWRAASKERFDVLLVNVVMPGVDGFVLAQRALQDNPLLQIIFITGFAAVMMDTQATPAYAPSPVISHSFHLKETAAYIRSLMTRTPLPEKAAPAADSKVVYADFNRKEVSTQQQFFS